MSKLTSLTNEELSAIIEMCKEELMDNCQMPSEHISGDFLAGKNYAYKEMVHNCRTVLERR